MSTGASLHVGVNQGDPGHYGPLRPLRGAERDAMAMAQLARASGFASCTCLTGPDATLAAVRSILAQEAVGLHAGDTFWLSFAGLGGAIPDTARQECLATISTFCLWDQQYVHDRLQADLEAFRHGVRVVVVVDSCPSGTPARAAIYRALRRSPALSTMLGEAESRALPPPLASALYLTHREAYEAWRSPPRPPLGPAREWIMLSACQPLQEAKDGPYHGKFTGALLTVWNGGKYRAAPGYSWADFVRRIDEVMGDPTQVPELGASELQERQLPFALE